jgi:hypothetical protein
LRCREHSDDFTVPAVPEVSEVSATDDEAHSSIKKKECDFGMKSGSERADGWRHFEAE